MTSEAASGRRRQRVIGRFQGQERGPLLIAIGGMHGNEPAGVLAIERLIQMLEYEQTANVNFNYRGRFVGLVGNVGALAEQKRFIKTDLNRWLNAERIAALRDRIDLTAEDEEAVALATAVENEVEAYEPDHVVVIDLHTTTADGGFFSIVNDSPTSRAIALDLHAPVILGMLEGLADTSLHFFTTAQLGVPTTSLVFESGQHNDPLSVDRAIAALVHAMRSIGAVHPRDVEGHHNEILEESARGLPHLVRFAYAHAIAPEDQFVMKPGYRNFMPVQAGEAVAKDIYGEITSPIDGLILMPLYQKQGDDGFFVVEEI